SCPATAARFAPLPLAVSRSVRPGVIRATASTPARIRKALPSKRKLQVQNQEPLDSMMHRASVESIPGPTLATPTGSTVRTRLLLPPLPRRVASFPPGIGGVSASASLLRRREQPSLVHDG